MDLSTLLSIRPGLTAMIGSGGKTTALYTLARELSCSGTVICCTSTHILPPTHMPLLFSPTEGSLAEALSQTRCLCLGTPKADGKLTAPTISMEQLTKLADYVLVEADGSKGLPIKAHLPHEPVIPTNANQVVLLVGASGFGQPVRQAVHRPERFCQLASIHPDDLVSPENLSLVLQQELLGDIIFVNQVDLTGALNHAKKLASLVTRPVYAGSLQGGDWTCLS